MKKIFHDIIPRESRSIRNIPITKKTGEIFDSTIDPANGDHTDAFERTIDGIHRPKAEFRKHKVHKDKHETESIYEKELKHEYELENNDKTHSTHPEEDSEDLYRDRAINKEEPESFDEWQKHQKGGLWRAGVLVTCIVVASVIFVPLYFSSAVISISPIKHDLSLSSTTLMLSNTKHELVDTEVEDSIDLHADGMTKVERKATGTIVLYNAFNSSSQKLIENTRLQTPNGRIYRLKKTVTIPGQKMVSGKAVPGSVEVSIEADEAGDEYNQGFRDFSIVAYKGTDRYEKIYGRSKTALTSGYLGMVPNISAKDIASSTSSLKTSILQKIDAEFVKKAKLKDSNYTYLPDLKKVTFDDIVQKVSKDGLKATITLNAKASSVIFDSSNLSEKIIKLQSERLTTSSTSSSTNPETGGDIETEGDQIVYEGDLSGLKVAFDLGSTNRIDSAITKLTLTGTTSITSALDKTKISRAVSNLTKEQAVAALKTLVELESVEIDISPWWKSTLPNADKIDIQTEN